MNSIAKILTVTVTLVLGTAAVSGMALAGPDSPFYPDHLRNPDTPLPSVGVGSGIPSPYRIGD
jgi:hypothetical protein